MGRRSSSRAKRSMSAHGPSSAGQVLDRRLHQLHQLYRLYVLGCNNGRPCLVRSRTRSRPARVVTRGISEPRILHVSARNRRLSFSIFDTTHFHFDDCRDSMVHAKEQQDGFKKAGRQTRAHRGQREGGREGGTGHIAYGREILHSGRISQVPIIISRQMHE